MSAAHVHKTSWLAPQADAVLKDGHLYSRRFADWYASRDGAYEQALHVFVQGNHLLERWQNPLPAHPFTIVELGFGTGRNFLVTLKHWRACALKRTSPGHLRYIGIELYPLEKNLLQAILQKNTALAAMSADLLAMYPPLIAGVHSLPIADNVDLILAFCEANDLLKGWRGLGVVDAWYLDGFAPRVNPALWHDDLYQSMAQLSHQGTTLSTYSAAGSVRRGLQAAGFAVEKVTGFANKREMLTGYWPQRSIVQSMDPLYCRAPTLVNSDSKKVVVIGAGLAGAAVADALARRHYQVQVIDQCANAGMGTSANPCAVLHFKMTAKPTQDSMLASIANLYTHRFLDKYYSNRSDLWQQCGLLRLSQHMPNPPIGSWINASDASDCAGTMVNEGGIWIAQGLYANLMALSRQLLHHPAIEWIGKRKITKLMLNGNQWHIFAEHERAITKADTLVIAAPLTCWPCHGLPLAHVRGQIDRVRFAYDALRCIVVKQGYVTPTCYGDIGFGASFTPNHYTPHPTSHETAANLARLTQLTPQLAAYIAEGKNWHDAPWLGFRVVAHDRRPLVGPIPHQEKYLTTYAALTRNARASVLSTINTSLPGLYVSLAHGGHGLSTCLLIGEVIASLIAHELPAITPEALRSLHPARFLYKAMRQQKIR